MTMLISGLTAYGFHALLYTDILSALILPITLSLAFGWLFLVDWLWKLRPARVSRWFVRIPVVGICALAGVFWVTQNQPFISGLTHDGTGLDTITLAENAPPGSTLMIAWGVRHFAVGFARDVLGVLPDIRLVDHKADFQMIVQQGVLVTPDYTFYNQPVSWWEQRLGTRVYLRAVAPYLVQIDARPELAERDNMPGIRPLVQVLHCMPDMLVLDVAWYTPEKPQHDLSVFVHLLDSRGIVIAQGDQSAPVYGWRPLTSWDAGEVVRDVYVLPRVDGATTVRYGLYQQLASGEFQNELEKSLPVDCVP